MLLLYAAVRSKEREQREGDVGESEGERGVEGGGHLQCCVQKDHLTLSKEGGEKEKRREGKWESVNTREAKMGGGEGEEGRGGRRRNGRAPPVHGGKRSVRCQTQRSAGCSKHQEGNLSG